MRLFVVKLLLFCVMCADARASLVIAVFRGNALYVAEDSQVMVPKDSEFVPTVGRKSFLSSTNSCITVTALVGTDKTFFPDLMENIFTNSYRPGLSLEVV